MREEEIFKILEEACILDKLCYEVDCLTENQLEAIRSLADLFKQEKEKNKELINTLYYKEKIIDELTQLEEDLKIELGKEKEKTPESVRKQFETYQNKICELEEKNKELESYVELYHNGELYSAKQLKNMEKTRDMYYIHKDKIREALNIGEGQENVDILELIKTLVAENDRLEDIEYKFDLAKEKIKELEQVNKKKKGTKYEINK